MKGTVLWRDLVAKADASFVFRGLGIRERMPPCLVNRPAGWEGFLVMLFHAPVTLGTPDAPRAFPAETLAIWPPGVGHYYGNDASSWEHSWFFCAGRAVADALGEAARGPSVRAWPGGSGVMTWYLQAIYDEFAAHLAPDGRIVANFVRNVVYEIMRYGAADEAAPRVPRRFLELRARLDQELDARHTVKSLAEHAGYSPPHFLRLFQRYFGVSPIEYLIRQRMHAAARLLSDQNLSVTEVAARVGYDDIYQFSRMFRRRMGASPTAMRRRSARR